MADEQTPITAQAEFESLGMKLHAVANTLTPAERAILEGLIRRVAGEPVEHADVEGFLSVGLMTPFGPVTVGADSVLGLFGFGSSPGMQADVRDHRTGGVRDHRTQTRDHR